MNPRVSRSSRAGLEGHRLPDREDRRAPGRRLRAGGDRQRHHRRRRPAAFEPTIDYVVVKWPRFAFEKFPRRRRRADDAHEVAWARRWRSAAPSSRRSPRRCARASSTRTPTLGRRSTDAARRALERPSADRYDVLLEALPPRRDGRARSTRARRSTRGSCASCSELALDPEAPFAGERSFKSVDTCAAEFEARTPYYYSGWERRPRRRGRARRPAARRDPRRGPEPHRPGHRVRLLLRARGDDRPRRRAATR